MARTIQSASVYGNATVRENVFRGAISKLGVPFFSQLLGTRACRARLREIDAEIDEILDIAGLDSVRDLLAGGLAFGYQKRLRSEEHTSELQSLMRISYAVFCLTKKKHSTIH